MKTLNDLKLLPPETVGKTPRIVLTGDCEPLIEQHRGLYSYDTHLIRVRTNRGLVSVTGEKMTIVYFGARDLLISGRITGICLESDQPC